MNALSTKFIFLFLLLANVAWADSVLDFPVWHNYEIKNGQWLYGIIKESPPVKNKLHSVKEVLDAILTKNSELKDPNIIYPGNKILLPAFLLVNLPQMQGDKIINYNFYYNSNIYYNSSTSDKGPKQIDRSLTSINSDNWIKYNYGAGLFYSYIESTQISNSSFATQASEANYQAHLSANHNFWKNTNIHYLLNIRNETYDVSKNALVDFSVMLEWFRGTKLNILSGATYRQDSIMTTESGSLLIEAVAHPQVDFSLNYMLANIMKSEISSRLSAKYLLSGKNDLIEIRSGSGFQLSLAVKRKILDIDTSIRTWYEVTKVETNLTEQNSTAVGLNINVNF